LIFKEGSRFGTSDPVYGLPVSRITRRTDRSYSTMSMTSNWFLWALLSAVFAALTAIFAKIGLEGVDSDLATLIRTVVIMAVLAAFVYFTGKWSDPFELSSRTWFFLVLSGLATGASWVCYFRALKIGDASKVAPVDKFSLLLVAVFAFFFLGERPSFREWAGILMIGAGVLVLAFKR
jgi:transporter family protein